MSPEGVHVPYLGMEKSSSESAIQLHVEELLRANSSIECNLLVPPGAKHSALAVVNAVVRQLADHAPPDNRSPQTLAPSGAAIPA